MIEVYRLSGTKIHHPISDSDQLFLCRFHYLKIARVAKALDILTTETVEPMNLESMDLGYKVTNFSVDEHPVEEDDSGSGSDECEHKCHDRVCNSTDGL
jgi:hypothetical protein